MPSSATKQEARKVETNRLPQRISMITGAKRSCPNLRTWARYLIYLSSALQSMSKLCRVMFMMTKFQPQYLHQKKIRTKNQLTRKILTASSLGTQPASAPRPITKPQPKSQKPEMTCLHTRYPSGKRRKRLTNLRVPRQLFYKTTCLMSKKEINARKYS